MDKPLKNQVYDFIKEFKSVPTDMILAFFNEYSEDRIKYLLTRLKNEGNIYQTDNNGRTSLNQAYANEPLNNSLMDALWVFVSSGSKNVQMYYLLKDKEYPKCIIYAVDDTLYEISVLNPTNETLYTAVIKRDIDAFHNAHSVSVALVYDKKSGEKALNELKFDAYCMLEFFDEEGNENQIPTPVFFDE